jgi:hypothetical protein
MGTEPHVLCVDPKMLWTRALTKLFLQISIPKRRQFSDLAK